MNSDSLNQRLILLVEEIKQYSANDCSTKIRVQRRIALNKFVNAVVNSGRLSKQTQWSRLPNYEDYHNEALQLTLMEICKKI
ncbi:MAG: sigma-70 family RNA polymerase sigma factor, partial [Cyanobacteria bacterium J06636_27]